MAEAIVKTENLTYEYIRRDAEGNPEGVTTAVDHLSLDIAPGSFVAVVGRNGSGKSTFARHLNALLVPEESAVWIDGMDTRDSDKHLDIRMAAGMVFQNPDNQIIGQVVEEDVAFGPENMGVPTEEIRLRVDEALELLKLTDKRLDSPNRLSGGQKQRVSIAGVLAMRPRCIILDEPTAMLDPQGRAEVIRTAHRLNREEGITVILITHHMEEAVDADCIYVLDKGKIAMQGTPREVFARVEELKALRLSVPQVTYLAWLLRRRGVALPEAVLTVEELVNALVV
ncbi:MAG: energy-coupling factor transporter ATPase [Lachnospiraceae bacterium]|nr:energy-coupling factor transporter ATPase [Lachnospiraceae bacterium]